LTKTKPQTERAVTVRDFAERKRKGEKLVVMTAYDALFGRLVDEDFSQLLQRGHVALELRLARLQVARIDRFLVELGFST